MSAGRESTRLKLQSWQVVGVSVRGSSHEERDQPGQDAHCWRILPSGSLIAAVADGAGSASLGEVGSELAVSAAVNALAEVSAAMNIDPSSMDPSPGDDAICQCLTDAMETAKAALETEAEGREVDLRELATTLILMIATRDGIAVAQVGDGAVAVADAQGNVEGVTQPQNGEYLNETTCLTSTEALDVVQTAVWRGVPAQGAIFSDGIQMLCLKMPEGIPHAPFFKPLFSFVSEIEPGYCDGKADSGQGSELDLDEAQEQLRTFLLSHSVASNSTDDRTLLLFSLTQPAGRETAEKA